MPDGHRIAVAIFTRGGTDRPRTIAEAARAIYDGFKTALTWPLRRRRSPHNSAAPHRRPREDRPLARGRAGRPLSEAHHLADEGHRTSRPRRQCAARCRRTASPSLLDERGEALSSMDFARKLETLARRRQARGALPDRRRRRPSTRQRARAPTCCCRSARRPGRTCWPARCSPSNCSGRHRSLRTTPIIAKDRGCAACASR